MFSQLAELEKIESAWEIRTLRRAEYRWLRLVRRWRPGQRARRRLRMRLLGLNLF